MGGAIGPSWTRNDRTPGGNTSTPSKPKTPTTGSINADGTPYVPRVESPVDKYLREQRLAAARKRAPGVWGEHLDGSNRNYSNVVADYDATNAATHDLFTGHRGTTKNVYTGEITEYDEDPTFWDWDDPRRGNPTTNPTTTPGSGSGPSVNQTKQWNDYRAAQMAILAGMNPYDVGPAPVDTLTGRVNTAVDADVSAVRGAWGGVADLNTNAYRDMPAVSAQAADPNIGALLRAQGMDGDFAAATQARQQQEMDGLASLWSNFGAAETARTDQANAGRNALVDEMEALDVADSEQQRASMLASAGLDQERLMREYGDKVRSSAAQNKDAKRKLIQQLLSDGLAQGMDISGIDIESLLGGL